ncbi:hypothetical protein [Marinobacter sp. ELB17]|uniref:hypothetical protein n=1 Tax=Marinobacter sp. ELB17 TaxID=270374 RepID=UPI0000F361CA|nr:hypothetical protein [Marinobacter sp. ELB17]EAZ97688.1 hypothetical protein MELB17_24187 [Marinobacter sp. ELB17]
MSDSLGMRGKWVRAALVGFGLAALSGCLQVGSDSADLAGTDANQNGIRDEVDSYIRIAYAVGPQRDAAEQYGRGLQKVVMMSTPDEAKNLIIEVSRSMSCLYSVFGGGNGANHPAAVSQSLEDETFDTDARKKANDQFSEALDGRTWGLPQGDTCE